MHDGKRTCHREFFDKIAGIIEFVDEQPVYTGKVFYPWWLAVDPSWVVALLVAFEVVAVAMGIALNVLHGGRGS